jgi:hypothetical protein
VRAIRKSKWIISSNKASYKVNIHVNAKLFFSSWRTMFVWSGNFQGHACAGRFTRPCIVHTEFWRLVGTMYVPSLVKIHWRMLILECSQGCYTVKIWPGDIDLWPWKSIGFQILLRTKYVPSLVKIHWRMLTLECSQGCDRRTDGSVTISLRNFVGEGIISKLVYS